MALSAIFMWENADSTTDLNARFSSIYAKGIISNTGGLLSPVAGQLQVTLQPYIAVGYDGMMVTESATQTFDLVIDQTNVIALLSVHNDGGAPTLQYGVFEVSVFNNLVNRDQYLSFGAVTVLSPATQATLANIDYSGRDQNDQTQRSPFRGRISSQTVAVNEVEGSTTLTTTNTSTLGVGYAVSGIGIPTASFITAISSPVVVTGTFTSGATTITVSNNVGILPGMLVTDISNSVYIPAGTTVVSIVGTVLTISQPTTATTAGDTISISGSFTINNAAISPGGSQSITAVNLPILTPSQSLPGDFYMVNQGTGDLASLWAWNGVVWINITDSQSIESELEQHEQNFFTDQKHLTDDEQNAALGSFGSPSYTNRYVTQLDPQLPTVGEAEALVGSDGTPGPSNTFITQQYPVAAATQISFVFPPGANVEIQASEGPVYVGLGPVGSANVFFMFMDSALKRGYVNSVGVAPQITGVFTDVLETNPLVPSTNANVDANGFFTGNLYLGLSTTIDTGFRVVFGSKQTLLSVTKDFTVNTTPGDDTVPSLVIQQVAELSGRPFDYSTPTNEQNINLRIDLNKILVPSVGATGIAQVSAGTWLVSETVATPTTFSGLVGIGTPPNAGYALNIGPSNLTGSNQYAAIAQPTFTSTTTGHGIGFISSPTTAASSFTMSYMADFFSYDVGKGSGSTISNHVAFLSLSLASGASNAVLADNVAFSGNYFINQSGTNPSTFGGKLIVDYSSANIDIQQGTTGTTGGLYFTVDGTGNFAGMQLAYNTRTTTGLNIFTAGAYNYPITFSTNNTLALTLDTSQNATFAGNVNVDGTAQIGNGPSTVGMLNIAGSSSSVDATITLQGGTAARWWIVGQTAANGSLLAIGGNGNSEPASGAINIDFNGNVTVPKLASSGSSLVFANASGELFATAVAPIVNGGTNNGSLPVTAGGVLYTDGTKVQNVGAGTAGQALTSTGTGPPIWGSAGSGPVGSVISAFLTETQFQSQQGTGWVLSDGRSVVGSAYATLTGNSTVPDCRGLILRGSNNGGSAAGTRSDGDQNPDGTMAVGTYQSDQFVSHAHSASSGTESAAHQHGGFLVGAGANLPAGGVGYVTDNTGGGINTASENTAHTHGITVNANGGNETRGKNITVNHFIRIN